MIMLQSPVGGRVDRPCERVEDIPCISGLRRLCIAILGGFYVENDRLALRQIDWFVGYEDFSSKWLRIATVILGVYIKPGRIAAI
jgi:hypothetical protein